VTQLDALLPALRAALDSADAEAAWYLDRDDPRVVEVRDGRTSVEDLEVEEVEDDEDRFAAIPAVTPPEVYAWMLEFLEEHDDPRLAALLDARRGAHGRFEKGLRSLDPEAAGAWERFRTARLTEVAEAWLDEVGLRG
jgi:hypothetical protein